MTIIGENLGKKYGGNWVFKEVNFTLDPNQSLSITGPNGSGKSTLLQVIIHALSPSRGQVKYELNDQTLDEEKALRLISFSSPYAELIEEYSLREHLQFHSTFRTPLISVNEMITHLQLESAANKAIADYSSGMKQRVKLGLQFYFENEVLALDEPTSNLDQNGVNWYLEEIKKLIGKRTILIASNNRSEYEFCENNIDLTN